MADNKVTEEDLKKAQQAAALVSAMFKGLRVTDAKQIALAFGELGVNFEKLNSGSANLKKVNENLQRLAKESFNTTDSTDKMIEGFEKLYKVQSGVDADLRKSYISRNLFALRMAKARENIAKAEEKGMLSLVKARWEKMGLIFQEKSTKVLGKETAGKMFPKLMALGGVVGTVAFGVKLMSETLKHLHHRASAITPAMSQVGLSMNQTEKQLWGVAGATTEYLSGHESLGRLFMTQKQAIATYQEAAQEGVNSLGFLSQAQKSNNEITNETRTDAIKHSQMLSLEMAKMSAALTGNVGAVKSLASISVKWKLTSKESIQVLGKGISNLSGITRVQAPLIMEMFENTGQAMMGTGKELSEMGRHFLPLIKNVRSFADAVGLTDREVAGLIQGVNGLTKSANTFTYMALRGPTGQGFEADYGTAIRTTPLEKNLKIMEQVQKVTKGNEAYAQMMLNQLGVTAGMSEAMQMNLIDAISSGKFKPEELTGKTEEQKLEQILGVLGEEAKEFSEFGKNILKGVNFEEQAIDYFRRMLQVGVDILFAISSQWGDADAQRRAKDLQMTMDKMNNKQKPAKIAYGQDLNL